MKLGFMYRYSEVEAVAIEGGCLQGVGVGILKVP